MMSKIKKKKNEMLEHAVNLKSLIFICKADVGHSAPINVFPQWGWGEAIGLALGI